MDPKTVTDASQSAFDAFRRDYLVASVVVLLLVNGAWAWALRWLVNRLADVQEARVTDQKEAKKDLAEASQRMAVHMDRSTEATTLMLAETQARSKRRRSSDAPSLAADSDEPRKLGSGQ